MPLSQPTNCQESAHYGLRDCGRVLSGNESDSSSYKKGQLNEFFINGEGIHHEVLQTELCDLLGSSAFARPDSYNVCKPLH